jgi:hypothetical protein
MLTLLGMTRGLQELQISHGSKLKVVPRVQSILMAQRLEEVPPPSA